MKMSMGKEKERILVLPFPLTNRQKPSPASLGPALALSRYPPYLSPRQLTVPDNERKMQTNALVVFSLFASSLFGLSSFRVVGEKGAKKKVDEKSERKKRPTQQTHRAFLFSCPSIPSFSSAPTLFYSAPMPVWVSLLLKSSGVEGKKQPQFVACSLFFVW